MALRSPFLGRARERRPDAAPLRRRDARILTPSARFQRRCRRELERRLRRRRRRRAGIASRRGDLPARRGAPARDSRFGQTSLPRRGDARRGRFGGPAVVRGEGLGERRARRIGRPRRARGARIDGGRGGGPISVRRSHDRTGRASRRRDGPSSQGRAGGSTRPRRALRASRAGDARADLRSRPGVRDRRDRGLRRGRGSPGSRRNRKEIGQSGSARLTG